MRIPIDHGHEHLEIEVPEANLVGVDRPVPAAPLVDPAAAVRAALESPHGYPALRLALTPDDRVAVVVDVHLPRLPELVVAILEHVGQAGVAASSITLLSPPGTSQQSWLEDLP